MKTMKITFAVLFLFSILCLNAQLKVASNNVGIQIGTSIPLSALSIGDVGSTDSKVSITGSNTALKVLRTGTSGTTNFGIDASTVVLGYSPYWNYGIRGKSYSNSISPFARTYGVFGLAGNGTACNYGLFGQLAGNANGSAVVGLVSSSVSENPEVAISGMYAGYFVGDVKVTGLVTAQSITSSDKRLKKNIAQLDVNKSLSGILSMNPVEYNLEQRYHKVLSDTAKIKIPYYNEKSQLFQKKHYGLLAQELQQVYPDLVYEDSEGFLAVDYVGIVPLLIQAIKELKNEVETLKTKNNNSTNPSKVGGIKTTDPTTEADALTYPLLDQNIPNPFTADTQIGYYLPTTTNAAVIYVYDMNGVQLKSYTITELGKGNLTIQGAEFNAGMYLYALIADGKVVDTKRMILTK